MEKWNLNNKTALVTGASSCLGRAISIILALAGAEVILHYNNSKEKVENLKKEIEKFGGRSRILQGDLSNARDVLKMNSKLKEWDCLVDILINNAAINHQQSIVYMDMGEYDRTMSVNLKAPYLLCKQLLRQMILRKQGVIINISSSITNHTIANESVYAMTKSGIEAMTRVLSKELGQYNVRVNCVAPGPFISSMNSLDSEKIKEVTQNNAIKKLVTPYEIAEVVLFLCSDYSSAITGQIINVDNGFCI